MYLCQNNLVINHFCCFCSITNIQFVAVPGSVKSTDQTCSVNLQARWLIYDLLFSDQNGSCRRVFLLVHLFYKIEIILRK